MFGSDYAPEYTMKVLHDSFETSCAYGHISVSENEISLESRQQYSSLCLITHHIHTHSAEKQVDFVKSRYHVEDYVSMQSIHQDDYGRLLHFVLTPIFFVYRRFFFCEIARLSGLTVIFYRLHHEDESALTRKRPLASCLDDMIPVNPRKQAGYRFPDISGKIEENRENDAKDDDMFSLFMMSPRLAMMPSANIDLRIIVVGASDCGIAFAEYLVLRSTYRYTNLTLISPHGLPYDNKCTGTSLLPFRGKFCPEYRHCVAVRAWINIVYGTMTTINRKEKYVTVKNQGNLAYDYLVLTCGLQYQRPTLREDTKARERGEEVTAESLTELPWNCLTINDDTEAFICLRKIRWLTEDFKKERAILFYGHNIDCYCAFRGLLEFGVNFSWITLIEPSLNPDETRDDVFCCDREVDEAVTNAVLRSGVRVLSGWCLVNWILTQDADGQTMIESVVIEKEGETKTLVCDVLLNFHEKTVNLDAFLAFCRAGLIFDGSLIIDPECRTNDPFIFAAGTLTKYSRKFHAESSQHMYLSSAEVGERLAEILRRVIGIQQSDEEISALSVKEKTCLTPPVFRAPVVVACILPGDYHYLHVHKSGRETSYGTAIKPTGEAFVTGSCTSQIGYFHIRLNSYDSVDIITCFSKKTFEVQDMIALYGKHESMLNELKFRFKSSSISDFYAYFREPWATAIYHDRFECLRVENRAALLSRMYDCSDSLVDDCMRALVKSKWQEIPEQDRRHIESRYAGSIYHRELEGNLINFLEFYESDLQMYCTPYKQRQMCTDIEENPLYFEQ
ncbi:PREDICTED: cilia- and flagella-associated protein 61-like isoform X2 [Dinoponera quadriceps]|uniref:Cilia- and flagella-associated protein 61-like isoform X2 n=1 Tax=Dinoponera quadriceps TaxID=609295 RepID=A0A6P3WZX1_DINQU|nr:PREDICTED: cilia- and flagella-associated protein 61-like isoform X2 [Dinoponera quadriceps]